MFLMARNSWGINFCGHDGVVSTIIVRFAKYASYCGLIFVDKRHTTKSTKIYAPRKFLHVWCGYGDQRIDRLIKIIGAFKDKSHCVEMTLQCTCHVHA